MAILASPPVPIDVVLVDDSHLFFERMQVVDDDLNCEPVAFAKEPQWTFVPGNFLCLY